MIPYAFAKARGVVVCAVKDGAAEVAVREGAAPGALAELRRALGLKLNARRVSAQAFDEAVAASPASAPL